MDSVFQVGSAVLGLNPPRVWRDPSAANSDAGACASNIDSHDYPAAFSHSVPIADDGVLTHADVAPIDHPAANEHAAADIYASSIINAAANGNEQNRAHRGHARCNGRLVTAIAHSSSAAGFQPLLAVRRGTAERLAASQAIDNRTAVL